MRNYAKKFTFFLGFEIRDDFLWTVITTTPVSILTGLAKIGGYLSLFTAMRFLLSVVHQRLFVRDLKQTSGKDRIERDFSYERLQEAIETLDAILEIPEVAEKVKRRTRRTDLQGDDMSSSQLLIP